MQPAVQKKLLELNQQFYQIFGAAFAATRRRIQPGVRRVLENIPKTGNWLDLGCGSGALALTWAAQGRVGMYHGLDFSAELLSEARKELEQTAVPAGLQIGFDQVDLGSPEWEKAARRLEYDGVLAFASLHHLPGAEKRLELMRQVHGLIRTGGLFIHSEWQFQHSPKLRARVQPWERVGLTDADVEPGDTLLDWRYALPGQPEQDGLRYVHLFSQTELEVLATQSGFRVVETFASDGQGGRLGLYQIWQKVD